MVATRRDDNGGDDNGGDDHGGEDRGRGAEGRVAKGRDDNGRDHNYGSFGPVPMGPDSARDFIWRGNWPIVP